MNILKALPKFDKTFKRFFPNEKKRIKEEIKKILYDPLIGELKKADIITPTTIAFFDIRQNDRVTLRQRMLLQHYWVRFDLNSDPLVQKRPVLDELQKLPTSFTSNGQLSIR